MPFDFSPLAMGENNMARAKQVGFLVATAEDDWKRYIKWFKDALKTDAVISYHPPGGANGDAAEINETAAYLAGRVDVIVTLGTGAALALKRATATTKTPFVFASVGDPGISGLTPQPGGNFTGGSNQQVGLATQRAKYMVAKTGKWTFNDPIAVVGNYFNEPSSTAMSAVCSALVALGRDARLASISPENDIDAFIGHLEDQGIQSLFVCSDLYLTAHAKELTKAARKAGMRTMWEFEEHQLAHGGDDYYGVSFKDLVEKAADYVDQILSGKKKAAGDLPIYTTTRRGGLTAAAAKPGGGAPPAKKPAAPAAKKKKRAR
jgi:ABC-type uncharacterized transport system substrate-binding protein